MGKNDDWIGALAIIGGLWLLGKALTKKNVDYFKCWNCSRIIAPNIKVCPFCKSRIDWGTAY